MLNGKKFPENVRALRILTEELLKPVIHEKEPEDMEALLLVLDEAAGKSRTVKLWVECLIKPVLIMLRYVRAEREGDWLLPIPLKSILIAKIAQCCLICHKWLAIAL